MSKRKWFKDAKIRLAATVVGAIAAIVAAGVLFDWRAAVGVFVAEIVACIVYSLQKLLKKKKGGNEE